MNSIIAESAMRILRHIRLPRHCKWRLAMARALRAERALLRGAK